MTVTLKIVKRNLLSGKWEVHPVRKKDRGTYRSDTYEVFNLVYDEHQQVVKNFYPCKICTVVLEQEQHSSGNWKQRRHKCYLEHKEKKKREMQESAQRTGDESMDEELDEESDDEDLYLDKIMVDANESGSDKNDSDNDVNDNENDNDNDDNDDDDDENAVDGQNMEMNDIQHALLALNLHDFGKFSIEHGVFSPHTIREFLPKNYGADDWYEMILLLFFYKRNI